MDPRTELIKLREVESAARRATVRDWLRNYTGALEKADLIYGAVKFESSPDPRIFHALVRLQPSAEHIELDFTVTEHGVVIAEAHGRTG